MSNPPTRNEILTALNVQAYEGATRDDLISLSGYEVGNGTRKGFGSSLSSLVDHKLIVEVAGKFYLREFAPRKEQPQGLQPYQNGSRAPVAPQVQKRQGKRVSLYTTPRIWEDAIAVSLLIENHWYEIPFWDSIRVCMGAIVPDWSEEKRTYTKVSVIKILRKNGMTDEEHPAPNDQITIDRDS